MMSPQKIFAVAGPGLGTGVTGPGAGPRDSSPALEIKGDSRLRHVLCRRHPYGNVIGILVVI